MFGNVLRLVGGPIGLAVTIAELILAASKIADARRCKVKKEKA